jgi:hypothetical protein
VRWKAKEFEAVWWEVRGPERYKGFDDLEAAKEWLRTQPMLSEWLIRQRSAHGWRAVASGTAATLRP